MATRQELKDKIEIIAKRVYAAKIKDDTLGITTEYQILFMLINIT